MVVSVAFHLVALASPLPVPTATRCIIFGLIHRVFVRGMRWKEYTGVKAKTRGIAAPVQLLPHRVAQRGGGPQ